MCNWVGMGECTSNSSQDEEGREALCTKIQRESMESSQREGKRHRQESGQPGLEHSHCLAEL